MFHAFKLSPPSAKQLFLQNTFWSIRWLLQSPRGDKAVQDRLKQACSWSRDHNLPTWPTLPLSSQEFLYSSSYYSAPDQPAPHIIILPAPLLSNISYLTQLKFIYNIRDMCLLLLILCLVVRHANNRNTHIIYGIWNLQCFWSIAFSEQERKGDWQGQVVQVRQQGGWSLLVLVIGWVEGVHWLMLVMIWGFPSPPDLVHLLCHGPRMRASKGGFKSSWVQIIPVPLFHWYVSLFFTIIQPWDSELDSLLFVVRPFQISACPSSLPPLPSS